MAICTPQNVYGSFQQTQFLGCSVLSFGASAGMNEQSSEVTVELVQDKCVASKVYFQTDSPSFTATTHIEADPGFTFPEVGAPMYFRVADFEYSGILQSWNQKKGSDGNPVYTVKLVDPRSLLDNVQVIIGEYQGPIQGMECIDNMLPGGTPGVGCNTPTYQLVNIINAYGFLDSLKKNCPLITSNPDDGSDDDVYFGAPAGGWGISSEGNAGIPWNYLKRAIQVLLGNNGTSLAPRFSKGYIYGPPGQNRNGLLGGYGEIYTGGSGGTPAQWTPAKYIIDLTEIPDAPEYYRITGPVITLSEIISQVCNNAGCDYYIELLPTASALVIKVRVIVRTEQPAMGEIQKFIDAMEPDKSGAVGISASNTIGKEYRPNPNNAFIIGDKKRSVYLHSGGWGDKGHQNLTGPLRTIQPYWGRDMDGNLNPAYESTCEITDTGVSGHWVGPPDWNVRLDFREINGLLVNDLYNTATMARHKLDSLLRGWVWEGELRASLGNFNTFINFLCNEDPYCSPAPFSGSPRNIQVADATVLKLWAKDNQLQFQNLPQPPAIGPSGTGVQPAVQSFSAACNIPIGIPLGGGPRNQVIRDAQRMHKWLQDYAQEYYGRKWLVEIPFACYAGDTGNPDLLRWTDEPSPEGGWTDSSYVLELQNDERGLAIDRFKIADGRIGPILRWTQDAPPIICTRNPCMTGLDYDQVPLSNMVTNTYYKNLPAMHADLYVWQKSELDQNWVTGSPYLGSNQNRVFALLTCDPVTTGFPINDGKRAPETFLVKSGLRDRALNINPTSMVGVGGQYGARMIHPLAAAVPVVSNTQTYGPWWKEAPAHNASENYGTVFAEQDTTLNPWEYGGTKFMNIGGISKVKNATTQMNAAERGEVTVAGYPTKGLGAGINTTINLYAARTLKVGSFSADGIDYYDYNYVSIGKSTSSASISNLNVVVSPQGVTTSYTMTTFTPVFGRFSKGNAERVKAIGKNKLRSDRQARKQQGKNLVNRMGPGGANSRAFTLLSSLTAGPAYSPNSPAVMFAGKLLSLDQRRKDVCIADKNTFAFYEDYANTAMMSIDGLLRPVAHTGARVPGIYWESGGGPLPAMKSYSDTFCPIGTGLISYEITGAFGSMTGSGSGFLGAYSGFPDGIRYENNYNPASPPPPIPHFSGLIVAANYLDPLADIHSNPKFITGARASGNLNTGTGFGGALLSPYASGHDIESVARGDLGGLERISNTIWSGKSQMIGGQSGRYAATSTDAFDLPMESGSGDYRFMALKGPLVLQSWGYDTYGKPIPNAKGHSGDPSYDTGLGETTVLADSGNAHQRTQDGLTDRFAPNWLSDATNWPVAPVDLRYDRIRGVWTTPPPFRLMKAMAVVDIVARETGLCELLTGGDMFDHNGRPFSGVVTIQPTGTGGAGETGLITGIAPLIAVSPDFDVSSGTILITYYDTYSCEHWVLGQGGSGGGGVDADVPVIGDFVCSGDVITTSSSNWTFTNGLLTNIS
jgi:hypothetical protein